MGHDQLKKCSKYHLVSLLDEKQRSTFAIFWTLFIQVSLLTNSALTDITSEEYQDFNLSELILELAFLLKLKR